MSRPSMSSSLENVPEAGLGQGGLLVSFVDQTLNIDLAEGIIFVLSDPRDRNRTRCHHGFTGLSGLFFEVLNHFVKGSCRYASRHPAVAVIHRASAGRRCATAVPNWN